MEAAILQRVDPAPEAQPETSGRFPTRSAVALYLTIPWLEMHDLPVMESFPAEAPSGAHYCVVHLPATGFPWQAGANVCLEDGEDTDGYRALHDLPYIRDADEVILRDAWGREYDYRVSETMFAGPHDARATLPMPGRDLVSLQTLFPSPVSGYRFVARADRVS